MFSFPIQPARFYRINREISNGGGALWDIGPYAIHTLRNCFKENPLREYGQSKLNEHNADISTTGMIDFGSNKKGTFDISFECTRRSEFEIFGENGRFSSSRHTRRRPRLRESRGEHRRQQHNEG